MRSRFAALATDAASGVTWLAPMRSEARAVRAGLRGNRDQRVLRTGAGRGAAMRAASSVPAVRDGVLVIAGVAGGLAPELRTGDVVVADRVLYAGSRGRYPAPPVRLTAARLICDALKAHGISARTGAVVTVDRLVLTANRDWVGHTTGTATALAVDLESVWLLRIPARLRCVIRVVADPAGGALLRPSTLHTVRTALASLTETVRALGPVLDPATVDPNPMSEHHQEVDAS